MMKKLAISFIFLFVSSSFAAAESNMQPDDKFNAILKRHESAGQLGPQELRKQKYQYTKNKNWQSNFSKQVRGVASKLNSSRDVIQLKNPAIEIPVK